MARPFYLVRHGQSDWNVLQLTQGQTMSPQLTSLGREQAAQAAELIRTDLGGTRVDVVRTSDLTRAVETAAIVAELLGGTVVIDPRLREQHLGDLEGRPYEETWLAAERHDWSDPNLPVAGGESPDQLRRRMADALTAIDSDQVTVLVSHGDAMRSAITELTITDGDRSTWIDIPNGAVAKVTGKQVVWLAT